ncbi:MAG: enoyl-CoA hydratase [Acetobacteraceae bacterium]|nr:enoyl-CoA hydratase [Acetobacteraceae bacterium]
MPGIAAIGRQVRLDLDDRRGGLVGFVTLDNPRLNTMNAALMTELRATLAALAEEPRLRAVVLTGSGEKAFVGGADINEMSAIESPADARVFILQVHGCCDAIRTIPVPTIARINGLCLGAGLELAAACDLRVAAEHAVFGMPEVKLGIPSVVEAALLPMLVGWGRTREMLLLGETFDAAAALAWGVVERAVPLPALDEAVESWVAAVLAAQPEAVRLQKRLIRSWEDLPVRAAVAAGVDAFASAYSTPEPVTAMRAFLATRARRKSG